MLDCSDCWCVRCTVEVFNPGVNCAGAAAAGVRRYPAPCSGAHVNHGHSRCLSAVVPLLVVLVVLFSPQVGIHTASRRQSSGQATPSCAMSRCRWPHVRVRRGTQPEPHQCCQQAAERLATPVGELHHWCWRSSGRCIQIPRQCVIAAFSSAARPSWNHAKHSHACFVRQPCGYMQAASYCVLLLNCTCVHIC